MPDDQAFETADNGHVDPLDREAAQIDARSEDVAEEIEELVEQSRALGRDAPGAGATPNG